MNAPSWLPKAVFAVAVTVVSAQELAGFADLYRERSPYTFGLLALPAAIAVGAWRQRCWQGRELDVHDRTVDGTAAITLGLLALALTALFQPRLQDLAVVLRVDLAALALWVAAISTALFGLRPTWRHRYVIPLLLGVWPIPVDMAALFVPRDSLGAVTLGWIAAVATAAVLRGKGSHLVVVAACGIVGALWTARLVPAPWNLVAALTAPIAVLGAARIVQARLLRAPAVRVRPPSGPAVKRRGMAALGLGVATATVLAPVPVTGERILGQEHALVCPPIEGVQHIGSERIGDEERYGMVPFVRCRYRTPGDRPRRAVVDIGETARPSELDRFPFDTTYRVLGGQTSSERQTLADGTEALVLTYDDPKIPLTTVAVTWTRVVGPARAQRTSVIVNDDPRPVSPFPDAGRRVVAALAVRTATVLRTNPNEVAASPPPARIQPFAVELATAVAAGRMAR